MARVAAVVDEQLVAAGVLGDGGGRNANQLVGDLQRVGEAGGTVPVVVVEQNRETVEALHRIERDAQAPFADRGLLHEVRELFVNPQTRVLQIDRVDWVRRHGHLDTRRADHSLAAEADEARRATARASVVDAIEIDEIDRLAGAVRMGDAGPQATGDISQVRVGIARLNSALFRVEVGTPLQPIVLP